MRFTGPQPNDHDQWITIPPPTQHKSPFRQHLQLCKQSDYNPYQFLKKQKKPTNTSFTLPNGQHISICSSSFQTLETYLANLTKITFTHDNSTHINHNNLSHKKISSPSINTLTSSKKICHDKNHIKNTQRYQQKKFPTNTSNYPQKFVSHSQLQDTCPKTMKFTTAILDLLSNSDFAHLEPQVAKNIYKKVLKLRLSSFQQVHAVDQLDHNIIISNLEKEKEYHESCDGDQMHKYTPLTQGNQDLIMNTGIIHSFPLEALYDLNDDNMRTLLRQAYDKSNQTYDLAFFNTCTRHALAIDVYDYVYNLKYDKKKLLPSSPQTTVLKNRQKNVELYQSHPQMLKWRTALSQL